MSRLNIRVYIGNEQRLSYLASAKVKTEGQSVKNNEWKALLGSQK